MTGRRGPGASRNGPWHVSGGSPYRHKILATGLVIPVSPQIRFVSGRAVPAYSLKRHATWRCPGNGQVPVTVSSRRASMAVLPVRTAWGEERQHAWSGAPGGPSAGRGFGHA